MKTYTGWRSQYPYFKVQFLDGALLVWRDEQAKFETEAEARVFIAQRANGRKGRVMKVEERRRYPIEES